MTRSLACWPIVQKVWPFITEIAGYQVDAITLGPGLTLVFAKDMTPDEQARLEQHEACHREQAKKFTPMWARVWPANKSKRLQQVGKAVASARFLAEYLRIWKETGYEDHPWERQARAAELV